MQTEKATYDPDLPHAYLALHKQAPDCGVCHRPRRDELHQVDVIERADHRRHEDAYLQTEKGS